MNIYALFGIAPEVQAYAMARYSRSAKSMADSVSELTAEKAEKFLNTFYFEYGHKSIADMAHIPFALEDISILAAMRVVDEQLWDGQERSTRYQNFRAGKYIVPKDIDADPAARETFTQACDALFSGYESLTGELLEVFKQAYPRPEDMPEGAYTRTLRARAFDISRNLLPLGTRTSVGQVVSARTLEVQISRLLADQYEEVRRIGEGLREACLQPSRSPVLEELLATIPQEEVESLPEPLREPLRALLEHLAPPVASPTLVKYTLSSEYPSVMLAKMREIAKEALGDVAADRSRLVALHGGGYPEAEAVATLLYSADPRGRSYQQVWDAVTAFPADRLKEVLDLAVADRGPHDELPREMRVGYEVAFDILMDLGAFRDLHRHRRCVQVLQDLTPDHGYDDPEVTFFRGFANTDATERAKEKGLITDYRSALAAAYDAVSALQRDYPQSALYALPLAYRTRALFKMDAAEAAYICELRSGVAGHFSYRHVAWEMYQEMKKAMPAFAKHLRVTNPNEVVDILGR